MRRIIPGLSISVLAVLAVVPAMAAEGRTPVFLDGTVILVDGDYVVTRDIKGAGLGPTISIHSSNVDLDLNGFTVSNTVGGPPVIEIALPASPERIRIHNGKLVGGANGIVRLPGAGPGKMVIVEDVRVTDNSGGPSIHLGELNNVAIRRCHIQDNSNRLPHQRLATGTHPE